LLELALKQYLKNQSMTVTVQEATAPFSVLLLRTLISIRRRKVGLCPYSNVQCSSCCTKGQHLVAKHGIGVRQPGMECVL